MKHLLIVLGFSILIPIRAFGQTEFVLDPNQSMLMTGKGPGQDATINPYEGEDCFAIIKNTGKRTFSIRIQREGKILQTIAIRKKEVKKVKLLAWQELYLDPNEKGISKARVDYEPIHPKER